MKKKNPPLSKNIVTQIITLISTSFGLVAALAWNAAITEYVNVYIKPYFSKGSGVTSLFIYAIGITILTVIVTVQMAKLMNRLQTESK